MTEELLTPEDEEEIKKGMREINEGNIIPLSEVEAKVQRDGLVCLECIGSGMGRFHHNRKAPCEACKGTGKVIPDEETKVFEAEAPEELSP